MAREKMGCTRLFCSRSRYGLTDPGALSNVKPVAGGLAAL